MAATCVSTCVDFIMFNSCFLQMLVTMIDDDPFVGRIATGRIASGVVRVNDRVKVITRDGAVADHLFSTSITPMCMRYGAVVSGCEDVLPPSAA